MGPTPVRSCITCRKKGDKGELIKLAYTPAGVVIDYSEKLPGRGAYVCADDACIAGCLKEGTLSRVFKHSVKPPVKDDFYAELDIKVNKKVESLLGMARKSGQAVRGFDAALDAVRRSADGLLVMAEDIADNTGRKFLESIPTARFKTVRYSTKEELGRVLGSPPVAVVFITGPALAAALDREIGRLSRIFRG